MTVVVTLPGWTAESVNVAGDHPSFVEESTEVYSDLIRVGRAIKGAKRAVVVCGAGVSVAASIPDFRSTSGLFTSLKAQYPSARLSSGKDLFSQSLFASPATTSLFYSMIASLAQLAQDAQPTDFHRLLKRMDEDGCLRRCYTQNIDGLEEKAGLSSGLGQWEDASFGRRCKKAGDSARSRARTKRKRAPIEVSSKAAAGRASDSSLLEPVKEEEKSDFTRLFPFPPRDGTSSGEASKTSAGFRALPSPLSLDSRSPSPSAKPTSSNPLFPRAIPLHGTLQSLTCPQCSYRTPLASPPNLALLAEGKGIACPQCQELDAVRSTAGIRQRGVGLLKVGVVLYGGQNEGDERIADCVRRDLKGVKEEWELQNGDTSKEEGKREETLVRATGVDGDAFGEMEREQAKGKAHLPLTPPPSQQPTPPQLQLSASRSDAPSEASFVATGSSDGPEPLARPPTKPRGRAPRSPRPVPPDLLIVAGTTLKVPGTRKMVRDFAKAVRGDSGPGWTSSSSSSFDEKVRRKGGGRPRKIRTVLLNLDFPTPAREWEGVFDVWVRGDVQTFVKDWVEGEPSTPVVRNSGRKPSSTGLVFDCVDIPPRVVAPTAASNGAGWTAAKGGKPSGAPSAPQPTLTTFFASSKNKVATAHKPKATLKATPKATLKATPKATLKATPKATLKATPKPKPKLKRRPAAAGASEGGGARSGRSSSESLSPPPSTPPTPPASLSPVGLL